MTPEQVTIVKSTFSQVLPIKEQAGKLFYDRLFTIAPDTRSMFKADIDAQARKLMDILAMAVSSLGDGPTLTAMLEGLGRRHAGYGVRDEHYDKVAEALLWTLEKGLGDGFTPAARDAWTALYVAVATTMKKSGQTQSAVA